MQTLRKTNPTEPMKPDPITKRMEVTLPNGAVGTITGDPNMPPETMHALTEMLRIVSEQEEEITCWDCDGDGFVKLFHGVVGCTRCGGYGAVPKITATWYETGKAIKRARLSRRVNLRDEAQRLGVNPMAYSDIELGKIDPATIAHLLPQNVALSRPEPLKGANDEKM